MVDFKTEVITNESLITDIGDLFFSNVLDSLNTEEPLSATIGEDLAQRISQAQAAGEINGFVFAEQRAESRVAYSRGYPGLASHRSEFGIARKSTHDRRLFAQAEIVIEELQVDRRYESKSISANFYTQGIQLQVYATDWDCSAGDLAEEVNIFAEIRTNDGAYSNASVPLHELTEQLNRLASQKAATGIGDYHADLLQLRNLINTLFGDGIDK